MEFWVVAVLAASLTWYSVDAEYQAGVGRADVTGPPAEINFMGYANLKQTGRGIHLRQFARAFVLESAGKRFAFVTVETAMVGYGIRNEVIKQLQLRYGSIYNESNVLLSGTHTHSAPGGFLMDFLFDLTIYGFVRETFDALVTGIVKSIIRAHESMQPARLFLSHTEVADVNVNRSPMSYLRNPAHERARYSHDVDKTMSQLRIESANGALLGAFNWFAVHATSMNNTNTLVSSDNVGLAALLLESANNPAGTLPGKGAFVGAFCSSNLGDVSPNTRGPHCEGLSRPCDNGQGLCLAEERCFATGPGRDMVDSCLIIGTRLADAAQRLLTEGGEELRGELLVAHQFVDMPRAGALRYDPLRDDFNASWLVRGCVPAMGYSFAAGTTDGPGAFSFTQGTKTGNPLWDAVRDFIAEPSAADIACHHPKPILLATGRITFPYSWQPTIVSLQLAIVGDALFAALPGELTTMAGRRVRRALARATALPERRVILAGLANVYADYITTYEEYQAQRYEAASAIYGPYTLDVYIYKLSKMTKKIMEGGHVKKGPRPIDLTSGLISLVPPVLYDAAPWDRTFGYCTHQPRARYTTGETVKATFIAGHPRNNLQHEHWYAAVERVDEAGEWTVVATDASWETRFIWTRSSSVLGTSYTDVEWDIPTNTPPGVYRLHHSGHHKILFGSIRPYSGVSETFNVI